MKKNLYNIGILLFIGLIALLASAMAFALETVGDAPSVENQDFVLYLIAAVGTAKGLTSLGIMNLVSQSLMKFLKTSWGFKLADKLNAKGKYILHYVIALVAGVVSLMYVGGISLVAAITSSSVVAFAASGVYAFYERFYEQK